MMPSCAETVPSWLHWLTHDPPPRHARVFRARHGAAAGDAGAGECMAVHALRGVRAGIHGPNGDAALQLVPVGSRSPFANPGRGMTIPNQTTDGSGCGLPRSPLSLVWSPRVAARPGDLSAAGAEDSGSTLAALSSSRAGAGLSAGSSLWSPNLARCWRRTLLASRRLFRSSVITSHHASSSADERELALPLSESSISSMAGLLLQKQLAGAVS